MLHTLRITSAHLRDISAYSCNKALTTHSLFELVESFLSDVLRFTVVRATVAMPRDLVPLHGRFAAVTYDRQSKRYRHRTEADLADGREESEC